MVEFCGYTVGQADLIRRGIGKKSYEIMEEEVPKIKPAFVKTMVEQYGDTEEHAREVADRFIQVFMDAVNYGFSINHSQSYSYIGYIATWLRHHYPLEFVASALQVWSKGDKNNDVVAYAESRGITINPPRFRKSKGTYFIDREGNAVYEGTGHIKGGNSTVGDTLYELRDREYRSFVDVIIDIVEGGNITIDGVEMRVQDFYNSFDQIAIKALDKTRAAKEKVINAKIKALKLDGGSDDEIEAINQEMADDFSAWYNKKPLGINKTKMDGLIRLNFFNEFGGNKKLQKVYDYVMANYKPNNKTFAGKQVKYLKCVEYEKSLEDERFSILEQCEFELEYTGRVTVHSETIPPKYGFVTKIDNIGKSRTSADVYLINKGKTTSIKVGAKLYRQVPFEEGDLLEMGGIEAKPRGMYVGGVWTKSETEKEIWVKELKFIRKSTIKKKESE